MSASNSAPDASGMDWTAVDDNAGGDALRESVDCRTVAGWLGMEGDGPARYCPRCQIGERGDKTPSLALGPGVYECYGCGARGDVVDLIAMTRHMSIKEAELFLAQALQRQDQGVMGAAVAGGPGDTDPGADAGGDPGATRGGSGPGVASAVAGRRAGEGGAERSSRGAGATRTRRPATYHEVYSAYLEACRPIPDHLMALLRKWGISRDVAERFGLRYYSHDSLAILARMENTFGRRALLDTGLLRKTDIENMDSTAFIAVDVADLASGGTEAGGRAIGGTSGAFEPYDLSRVPYLLIPYYRQGEVVYLKARPLADTARLARLKLPVSLATGDLMPCMFNQDVLSSATEVLVLRRELDAMACESVGVRAIACSSLSHFQPSWARLLRHKTSHILLDAEKANDPRVRNINAMFDRAGVDRPHSVVLPRGADLGTFVKQHFKDRPQPPPRGPERRAAASDRRGGGGEGYSGPERRGGDRRKPSAGEAGARPRRIPGGFDESVEGLLAPDSQAGEIPAPVASGKSAPSSAGQSGPNKAASGPRGRSGSAPAAVNEADPLGLGGPSPADDVPLLASTARRSDPLSPNGPGLASSAAGRIDESSDELRIEATEEEAFGRATPEDAPAAAAPPPPPAVQGVPEFVAAVTAGRHGVLAVYRQVTAAGPELSLRLQTGGLGSAEGIEIFLPITSVEALQAALQTARASQGALAGGAQAPPPALKAPAAAPTATPQRPIAEDTLPGLLE